MKKNVEELVARINPQVRREVAYAVGTFEDISVKINQNENPLDLPKDLKRKILKGLGEIDWNRYPDRFGDDLRKVLSVNFGIHEDGILLGNGSNELVYLLTRCLLTENSKVALPDPMFSLYEKAVRLQGAKTIELPGDENFDLEINATLDLLRREDPDLVILTSPNNPTGRAISIENVESILKVSQGYVLVDEAYFEFLEGPNALSLMKSYPNLIVLRTFSKALGLAGIRIGYILAHPQIMDEFYKLRLPFMIDRLSSFIATSILKDTGLLTERLNMLKTERDNMYSELSSRSDLQVIRPQANFILFKSSRKSVDLIKDLARKGVLIRDMSGYKKLKNYVRVSVGTPSENKIFLRALSDCGLN